MAGAAMGLLISRSHVPARLSHGVTSGPTALAVNHSAIATMPGTSCPAGTVRPILKARKKKTGNSTPNINTGDLR